MKQNESIIIRGYQDGFNLELSSKRKNISFSSCYDFSVFLGLDIAEIKDIVSNCGGSIIDIDLSLFNEFSYRDENNIMQVIHFKNKEDCNKTIALFSEERKITCLLNRVRNLEKKYNSKEKHSREELKACYTDDYIQSIWNIEKYTEESGEGFLYFDDFLVDYIEQNLIFE